MEELPKHCAQKCTKVNMYPVPWGGSTEFTKQERAYSSRHAPPHVPNAQEDGESRYDSPAENHPRSCRVLRTEFQPQGREGDPGERVGSRPGSDIDASDSITLA